MEIIYKAQDAGRIRGIPGPCHRKMMKERGGKTPMAGSLRGLEFVGNGHSSVFPEGLGGDLYPRRGLTPLVFA